MNDGVKPKPAEVRDQDGQVMAEYAIVLALLTVGIVAIFTLVLPGAIEGALNAVTELL